MEIHSVVMQTQLVGYEFKKNAFSNKNLIEENNKVSNDYFWKSNEYIDRDCFGRVLDLTALINQPDGHLQGTLSDSEDVDYYKFSISEYRALSFVSDKYNLDITITLDNIPKGCDYDLILYDSEGNQVGIGTGNGNKGKSITIPNWSADNKGYTVKVQAKSGSSVNPDKQYHLSFQTAQADKNHSAYQEMLEIQQYAGIVRQQMYEGQTNTEEMQAILEIRKKYKAVYAEQLEKLHMEQAKEQLQGEDISNKNEISDLLDKMAAGEVLTDQEMTIVNIFATAQEFDSAKASAELNTTLKEKIICYYSQLI